MKKIISSILIIMTIGTASAATYIRAHKPPYPRPLPTNIPHRPYVYGVRVGPEINTHANYIKTRNKDYTKEAIGIFAISVGIMAILYGLSDSNNHYSQYNNGQVVLSRF